MKKRILAAGVQMPDAWNAACYFAKKGECVCAAVTNGDRELAEKLSAEQPDIEVRLLDTGSDEKIREFASELLKKWEGLDILVIRAGWYRTDDGPVGSHDYVKIADALDRNVNGAHWLIEGILPLMEESAVKRIAFLTEPSSSVGWSCETENYAYQVSLACLNMMEKLYFNRLRPKGFTFRCYCSDGREQGGMSAGAYIAGGLCYDEKEPYIHSDENRLVMRDAYRREIPW